MGESDKIDHQVIILNPTKEHLCWNTVVRPTLGSGDVRVLCSTTTLAVGVNLPARRVIVRHVRNGGGGELEARDLQQMTGRAGRKVRPPRPKP